MIPGSQVSVSQPSLAGLQAALAAGTLSSAALTGFYLQRIERLNPALHAVITVNPDAPAEAAASDAARAADGPRGPLEGIPVLVKDNIQVAGMPTTAGLARPAAGRTRRRLPGRPAPRGRRGDHRQGEPVRVGQLPVHPLDQRLVHARRPDREPVRAGPQPVRVEFGVGGRGSRRAGAARGRHRDRRLDRLPGQRLRDRRHQAHQRAGQPPRHRAHLTGAGHRGTDGGPAWRTPRPCSRSWPPPTPRTRSRRPRMNWPNGPGCILPAPLTSTPSTPPPWRGPAWASGGTARPRPGRPPPRCSTRRWPGCARSARW